MTVKVLAQTFAMVPGIDWVKNPRASWLSSTSERML